MRKIDFSNIKNVDLTEEYLLALGFRKFDEENIELKESENINKLWNEINNKCPKFSKLLKYGKENNILTTGSFKEFITLNYKKMIRLYLFAEKLKKSEKDSNNNTIDNDQSEIDYLNELFDYKKHYKDIQKFFNSHIQELDLYTCPYCETAYTGFFENVNDDGKKEQVNYDLDHFIPKSTYPMFAISMYNFIPSCQMCNQRIKNDNDLKKIYGNDFDNLLKVSPISPEYSFDKDVKINFIPKLEIKDIKSASLDTSENVYLDKHYNIVNNKEKAQFQYKYFHYAPISQNNSEQYKVYFKTNDTVYNMLIKTMKLADRYNSTAIKSVGLYLLDLKKQYPKTYREMISTILAENGIYESPKKIYNSIFHFDEKYQLLQKLRKDILDENNS